MDAARIQNFINRSICDYYNKAEVDTKVTASVADAIFTSDTTTAGIGFVVDEDDMSSNSATKVATQQSVKAYADSLVAIANVGAVGTGHAVAEEGNSIFHRSTISLAGTLPAIAGGAALAVGILAYTFPAGVIRVSTPYLNGVSITQSEGNIAANTPDVGLGTSMASGVVATLDGTPAFENILTGQTMGDCDGTVKNAGVASTLIINAADDHTVYFNVADTWAASGDAAATLGGDIVLTWEYLSAQNGD